MPSIHQSLVLIIMFTIVDDKVSIEHMKHTEPKYRCLLMVIFLLCEHKLYSFWSVHSEIATLKHISSLEKCFWWKVPGVKYFPLCGSHKNLK